MTKVYSKALDKSIEVGRLIGKFGGDGPTAIFTGGIHGNEPSGVFALHRVVQEIEKNKLQLHGSVYAISGNLWALEKQKRFHEKDLNRMWKGKALEDLLAGKPNHSNNDVKEQIEIYTVVREILDEETGPFYFMDLHTTSSETIPFLTVNDSLLNRKFTEQYPVPMILGIEEYLDGPLLSYINELGYVAFGYEGGQHDDLSSIENHVAFIYLSLVFAGILKKEDIDFNHYHNVLAKITMETKGIYEIYHRHAIKEGDTFNMQPGYCNFQWIQKGRLLATSNGEEVLANKKSCIFMPLYQSQGDDGFFLVRKISPFFLRLSAVLRRIHFDRILPILPGIRWENSDRERLIVNRKIARLFATQFFHLLGYRSKKLDKTHLTIKNREANSRDADYKKALWY